ELGARDRVPVVHLLVADDKSAVAGERRPANPPAEGTEDPSLVIDKEAFAGMSAGPWPVNQVARAIRRMVVERNGARCGERVDAGQIGFLRFRPAHETPERSSSEH